MARITIAQLEAFLAFGRASIAVCDVRELARRRNVGDASKDLVAELRDLFAKGLDDAVCVLAGDVMELASRTADVLKRDQGPSGQPGYLARLLAIMYL
jgi:hypothetical protein